jgi:hypothetical protein
MFRFTDSSSADTSGEFHPLAQAMADSIIATVSTSRVPLGAAPPGCREPRRGYSRADIYYSNWYMSESGERPALDRELRSAREEYGSRTSMRNSIEIEYLMKFVLQVDALSELSQEEPGPPRLVIDVFREDGKMVSYFADSDYLWDAEGKRGRPFGCEFRSRFSFDPLYDCDGHGSSRPAGGGQGETEGR